MRLPNRQGRREDQRDPRGIAGLNCISALGEHIKKRLRPTYVHDAIAFSFALSASLAELLDNDRYYPSGQRNAAQLDGTRRNRVRRGRRDH